jgi:uroporphyrinogen-III synthase
VATELRDRGLSAVTVHSGESLAALGERVGAHLLELFTMPLVVPSERVAAQARELGFLNVHNAGGAGVEMMLAALVKIYSSGH